ncbi:hypothetical protein D3C87_1399700 [compost metagenome]
MRLLKRGGLEVRQRVHINARVPISLIGSQQALSESGQQPVFRYRHVLLFVDNPKDDIALTEQRHFQHLSFVLELRPWPQVQREIQFMSGPGRCH